MGLVRLPLVVVAAAAALATSLGHADAEELDHRLGAASASELTGGVRTAPKTFTLGAYAEVCYQWNFNTPGNDLTNYRGFDNRHNSFTLPNVAFDAQWDYKGVVGRVTLQVGHTASTYYGAEPGRSGAAGANASGPELWRFVQQAYVGYRIPVGRGLLVQAGLFLSPIGPEGIAVRDNWNWSRSTLFFALPYYHTGLRVSYPLSDRWALTLAAYNGWNSVVDNNAEKSISLQATYTRPERLALSVLYFVGVEREREAREGRAWRHLLDAHATWDVVPRLSLLLHLDGGLEPNAMGLSAWIGAALYARVKLLRWLYLAARGDALYERVPAGATAVFYPASWVASGTGTVELRPHERVVFRLEYRHDHGARDLYFAGAVQGAGTPTAPYLPNRRYQDTLTVGATTWF
ncbi:MAG: porin [Deltaproteobacteria bacterium]|nr:porin [Deltaproteobacteria bacterium]